MSPVTSTVPVRSHYVPHRTLRAVTCLPALHPGPHPPTIRMHMPYHPCMPPHSLSTPHPTAMHAPIHAPARWAPPPLPMLSPPQGHAPGTRRSQRSKVFTTTTSPPTNRGTHTQRPAPPLVSTHPCRVADRVNPSPTRTLHRVHGQVTPNATHGPDHTSQSHHASPDPAHTCIALCPHPSDYRAPRSHRGLDVLMSTIHHTQPLTAATRSHSTGRRHVSTPV